MRVQSALVVAIAAALLLPGPAWAGANDRSKQAAGRTTCNLPESDAESLELLSTYYQGYWWDHTDLTIAVQAHPNANESKIEGSARASRCGPKSCSTASTGSSP